MSSGFSWSEWLEPSGMILDEPPRIGDQYAIRFPGNFSARIGQTMTLRWLPADSTINGVDASNAAELEKIRFVSGTVVAASDVERAIIFQPNRIQFPEDLCALEPRVVEETDTLFLSCARSEYCSGRFTQVEFNLEGDVTTEYLFFDRQLVMLEHTVFGDAYFWIGNGTLSPHLASYLFIERDH